VLALAAGAEVFRIGFFADDFHFLDIARRVPLLEALGGQFGVYPWYRPLSRESYFALIAAAGPAGALVARTLSLAAMVACVLLVDRIGRVLVGGRAARIGAVLFAIYGFTRFLTAWASGFQDLLGLLLTLAALDASLRGRTALALVAAGLAPFAKETSIVVFPLLVLFDWARGRVAARRMVSTAAVLLAVLAVHAAVRLAWQGGGTAARIDFAPRELLSALGVVVGAFAGGVPVLEPLTVALSLSAAAAALAAMASAGRVSAPEPVAGSARAGPRPAAPALSILRGIALAAGAAALGLLPMAGGNLLRLSAVHPYYAYAAAPWLALLLGAGLGRMPPAPLLNGMVALLAGWNVLALGFRSPDMGTLEGWQFRRWDWREAVRLTHVSRRLGEDLRALLSPRPESLVVCYAGLPAGSFFQTEDGPATRVSLGDPSVRSYWVNATPYGATPGRVVLLDFDPATLHLRRDEPYTQGLTSHAASSVAAGEPGPAWAFAAAADSAERSTPQLGAFRSVAALLAEGPEAFRRELARAGFGDSTGSRPAELATLLLGERAVVAKAYEEVLRSPLNADAHAEMAERFAEAGGLVSAAIELRIALALEPRPASDRVRLAELLDRMGMPAKARTELAGLIEDVRGTPLEAVVRARLADLDRRGAGDPQRAPTRALGRPVPPPETAPAPR